MARKHVDLKAAKAAKQKKIAIVGGVLFLGLLGFSVPQTLKMLHHKPDQPVRPQSAVAQAAPTDATTPVAAPVSNSSAGTTVLTAQLAPAARAGQLSALSASFKSKDPFVQLIPDDTNVAPSTDTTAKPAKPAAKLKVVPTVQPAPATTAAPAVTAAPKVVLPVLSAVISVNGVREGVNVKGDFPLDSPLFHLVVLGKRTAKISVVGGSLASGAPTLTLRRGKAVTLVNTADGTRYRIVLVSTSTASATQPAQTSASGQPQTTTTPSETTTSETTTTATLGG